MAAVPTAARQKIEFAYNYQGQRIQKRVYSWDDDSRLPLESKETDESGRIIFSPVDKEVSAINWTCSAIAGDIFVHGDVRVHKGYAMNLPEVILQS
ncbi:MAG: hypothetical protein AB1898_20185 [Acidobacteriota bacterium]